MAKFEVWVSTDKIGSKCTDYFEVEDEELEGLTEEEIDDHVWSEYGKHIAWQMIEAGHRRLD